MIHGPALEATEPVRRKKGQRRPDQVDVLLGERLKQLRHRYGYTLDDFARRLGCTLGHLHRYEKGRAKISAATLIKAATILGIRAEEFVEDLPHIAGAPRDAALRKLNEAFARITDDARRKLIASFVDGIARGVHAAPFGKSHLSIIDGGTP